MIAETLISIAIGILIGVISGLVPGIHVNLISSLSILFYNELSSRFPPIWIITSLVSMLTTAIFLNFIPSLILGVPDPEKTIVMKPLHKAIINGKAHLIIKQIAFSLTITSLACIILLPWAYLIIKKTSIFAAFIPYILIAILLLNLKNEKNKSLGIVITILAGILGITAFSIEQLKEPLLPLLSGLFGISSIIDSISQQPKFKKQFFSSHTRINKKELVKIPLYTSLVSLFSFIPAVSSSQFVSIIKKDEKTYALACSSFTIATALISFITVYTLNRARNGVAVASISFLSNINIINLIIIASSVLVSSAIASLLLIKLSKWLLKNISLIPYKKVSISVLVLVIILIILIAGFWGVIIALLASCLGMICSKLELNRNYLMASLIIPTIFYFI